MITQRLFMDELVKKLNIENGEGWLKITSKTIKQHGGLYLLHKYDGSPKKLLSAIYPEYL